MNKINFLIIGLGSMGKRRIRNLLHWKIPNNNIYGFDISSTCCKQVEFEYKIKCFNNFKSAIKLVNPDAYIISTPPNKHIEYILYAAKRKKHFFSEVDTSPEKYNKFMKYLNNSFVAAPSCSFRYFQPIKIMKFLIKENKLGKLLLFNHHMGQYLPDWHPWEDYRNVYFAQKETSAIKEMIPYELNWIQWLVNSTVNALTGLKAKTSDLEIKADDAAISVIKMNNGLIGSLTIDVVSKLPIRRFLLIGDKGQIEWNWKKNIINYYNYQLKKNKIIKYSTGKILKNYILSENMYNDEIKDFINAINNKSIFPYTFKENLNTLKLFNKLKRI